MRSFLSVFLFVLSSNLDTFVIVLAYQINRIRISYLNGLVIGAVTAVFTFAAVLGGDLISKTFFSRYSDLFGGGILILFGCYMVLKFLKERKKQDTTDSGSAPSSEKRLPLGATLALSMALSINNIGLGIAAGIADIPAFTTAVFTFICTFLCIFLANLLGKTVLSKWVRGYSLLITGILLAVLGIFECI